MEVGAGKTHSVVNKEAQSEGLKVQVGSTNRQVSPILKDKNKISSSLISTLQSRRRMSETNQLEGSSINHSRIHMAAKFCLKTLEETMKPQVTVMKITPCKSAQVFLNSV